jgi:hypothetical protein
VKKWLVFIKNVLKLTVNYLLKVVLIMEDIYEKLNLIDYKEYFCKPLNLYELNKLYFAFENN